MAAAEATATKRPAAWLGPAQQRGDADPGGDEDRPQVCVEHRILLGGRHLPQRHPSGNHPSDRDHRVDAPELVLGRADGALHVLTGRGIADERLDRSAAAGARDDLLELLPGPEPIREPRIVGATVDGENVPARLREACHGGRADTARRAGDDRRLAHPTAVPFEVDVEQRVDLGYEPLDQRLAIGCRSAPGVTQDTVLRNGRDPVLAKPRQQLVDRLRRADGPLVAYELRGERKHQRSLHPACVCVSTIDVRLPQMHPPPLGAQPRDRSSDRLGIAAVPRQQGDIAERRRAADEFDQGGLERRLPQRERPRKAAVLATGPVRQRRRDDDVVSVGGHRLGDARGDQRVGVQRQVRAVLLGRPQGDQQMDVDSAK